MTVVFEFGVSLSVPRAIGVELSDRQRCGRPKGASVFIADVDGFGRWVRDGIVAPGGQTVRLAVAVPATTGAGLTDKTSEDRIRDHIDPRKRCDGIRS